MLHYWMVLLAPKTNATEYWPQFYWAESASHAREQAENAEPDNRILGVYYVPDVEPRGA